MDYEKIYKDLCERNKDRLLTKEVGYEVHHIKPRCLGGEDIDSNLVKLTYKEHLLAHKLLVRIHPDNYKLMSALFLMTGNMKKESSDYTNLRKEWSTIKTKEAVSYTRDLGVGTTMFGNKKFRLPKTNIDDVLIINTAKDIIAYYGKNVTNTRLKNYIFNIKMLLFLSVNYNFINIPNCSNTKGVCMDVVKYFVDTNIIVKVENVMIVYIFTEEFRKLFDTENIEIYRDLYTQAPIPACINKHPIYSTVFTHFKFYISKNTKGLFSMKPLHLNTHIPEKYSQLVYKYMAIKDLNQYILDIEKSK